MNSHMNSNVTHWIHGLNWWIWIRILPNSEIWIHCMNNVWIQSFSNEFMDMNSYDSLFIDMTSWMHIWIQVLSHEFMTMNESWIHFWMQSWIQIWNCLICSCWIPTSCRSIVIVGSALWQTSKNQQANTANLVPNSYASQCSLNATYYISSKLIAPGTIDGRRHKTVNCLVS